MTDLGRLGIGVRVRLFERHCWSVERDDDLFDQNKDKVNKNKFNGVGAGSQWVDVLLNDPKSPKDGASGDGQGINQKARLCVSQAHGAWEFGVWDLGWVVVVEVKWEEEVEVSP